MNKKSREKGDFQARFRENLGVKFPGVTRFSVIKKTKNIEIFIEKNMVSTNHDYTDLSIILRQHFPLLARATELNDQILELASTALFQPGEMILREGAFVKHIPLVVRGLVKVFKEDDEGNEVLLYYIKSGESCVMSLTACLRNEKSSVKAIIEEESEIMLVPATASVMWTRKYPEWNEFSLQLFNSKYHELLHIVNILTFHKKEARLMDYLYKKAELTHSKTLTTTHQEVANDLGSTREVISRLLKKLEHEGMVLLGMGEIIIK
jgi:CRP/FNR family transcriptional regulator